MTVKLKLNKFAVAWEGKKPVTGKELTHLGWESIEILMCVPYRVVNKVQQYQYLCRTDEGLVFINQDDLNDEIIYENYIDAAITDSELAKRQKKWQDQINANPRKNLRKR